MTSRPDPSLARDLFVRGDFGFDQNAVLTGKTLREMVSVNNPWGAVMEFQRRTSSSWETLHTQTLTDAEVAGGWVETPVTTGTVSRSTASG